MSGLRGARIILIRFLVEKTIPFGFCSTTAAGLFDDDGDDGDDYDDDYDDDWNGVIDEVNVDENEDLLENCK